MYTHTHIIHIIFNYCKVLLHRYLYRILYKVSLPLIVFFCRETKKKIRKKEDKRTWRGVIRVHMQAP